MRKIGIVISAPTAHEAVAKIKEAESVGIYSAWLTSGSGGGGDGPTILAVAGSETHKILLGTAVTPSFPRHPIVLAQQLLVINQVAPGRFRLGVGTSSPPSVQEIYGIDFYAPLAHLSEYIYILQSLISEGEISFDGVYYKAHTRLSSNIGHVPVMASALRQKAFQLCGRQADGAITWVCPPDYIDKIGMPAMEVGAREANRQRPPLIVHVPICASEDIAQVRTAVKRQLFHPQIIYYQEMFADAGFPEAYQGEWSDAMIESTVVWGNDSKISQGISALFSMGADEIMVTPILTGDDLSQSYQDTLSVLASNCID